jgi:hydrogenase maturation protein HypF
VSTFQIIISGQVQGVGFRPFIYQLAKEFGFHGSVSNNEKGVVIHINTEEEKAQIFLAAVLEKAPVISNILSYEVMEVSYREYADFKIVPSVVKHQINIPLTPDFAICESCKSEIRDGNNRRFDYPFTTCTNCGPRFSVTTMFPFEREHTTLDYFVMCGSCQQEYSNQDDRRFHSQTNGCMDCGIQMRLTDENGKSVGLTQTGIVREAANLILDGNIIAIKNTNGYLLCCDANNRSAIQRLRKRKQRPTKPFALLYPSLERIKDDFELSGSEKRALSSPVAPIVVLKPKKQIMGLEEENIAPGLHQLGVMLPSSALLTLLMDELKIPIIATSGNIHGSPIIAWEKHAISHLKKVADYFLHHNLNISFPQDDSVVRFTGEHQLILRRSRGLAPNYNGHTCLNGEKILAMGAHLKSTFAFVPNSHTYITPYFGNLDSYEVSERFRESLDHFLKLFETIPETILIDAHPHYHSSILGRELADKWNSKLIRIQHHKAHFASVLAEHNLFDSKEKILGVIWDGTGYGEDGAIWGGEFFTYENSEISRLAQFEYVDWLAADKMAKEPRLSLLSLLPEDQRDYAKHKFSATEWKVYAKMIENNTLKTSSVGRLFDAVSSLLDLSNVTTYEGEAAMLLENRAGEYDGEEYFDFLEGIDYEVIPSKILLGNILKVKNQGVSEAQIANSFIHTLALLVLRVAERYSFKTIVGSGGVFQNALLIEKLLQLSQNSGIEFKINRILSSNDENISFGQLCYYQHVKN